MMNICWTSWTSIIKRQVRMFTSWRRRGKRLANSSMTSAQPRPLWLGQRGGSSPLSPMLATPLNTAFDTKPWEIEALPLSRNKFCPPQQSCLGTVQPWLSKLDGTRQNVRIILSSNNRGYLLTYAFMHDWGECLDNWGVQIIQVHCTYNHPYTVDWEIFAVKKFSSIALNKN